MYSLKNLPNLTFKYNELKTAATLISQKFEKIIKGFKCISEIKSEDSGILFTLLGVELKLQAEIDPNGIQNEKGKLRTYKINPLAEKQKQEKLDIEFAFDGFSNITYEVDGKVIKRIHHDMFPNKYIEFIIPNVLENYTIILKKNHDQDQ